MIAIGVDVLERPRADRLLRRERSHHWIFSAAELDRANGLGEDRRLEWLAGRFCAKEAVAKVLGRGPGAGLSWRDVEVLGTGAPVVRLHGEAAATARERGIGEVSVSLSHQPGVVVAVAVAVAPPPPRACGCDVP